MDRIEILETNFDELVDSFRILNAVCAAQDKLLRMKGVYSTIELDIAVTQSKKDLGVSDG